MDRRMEFRARNFLSNWNQNELNKIETNKSLLWRANNGKEDKPSFRNFNEPSIAFAKHVLKPGSERRHAKSPFAIDKKIKIEDWTEFFIKKMRVGHENRSILIFMKFEVRLNSEFVENHKNLDLLIIMTSLSRKLTQFNAICSRRDA